MKRAIVIGATSGIGRDLVHILAEHGYVVGATGRRQVLLESLRDEIAGPVHIRKMDIAEIVASRQIFTDLIREMEGMDLVVVNAGVGNRNPNYDWAPDKNVIDINVRGFAALTQAAWQYFARQGHGHLVGISSLAGRLSTADSTAYSASKAFVSTYLRGLDHKSLQQKTRVRVTLIEPGFIRTPLTEHNRYLFWSISSDRAARLIYRAIRRRRRHAYIPGRWRLIAWLIALIPEPLMRRIS